MLLVVKPGGAGFLAGSATVMALLSVVFCAIRDMVTRFIDPAIPTIVITLTTCVAVGLFGAAMIPVQGWVTPSLTHVGLLLAAATVVVAGNHAMILAFRGVEVSLVSPFRYTVMVWAIVSGIAVFGEWPDMASWIGIGLIVGAGLYTLHRERVRPQGAPRRGGGEGDTPVTTGTCAFSHENDRFLRTGLAFRANSLPNPYCAADGRVIGRPWRFGAGPVIAQEPRDREWDMDWLCRTALPGDQGGPRD